MKTPNFTAISSYDSGATFESDHARFSDFLPAGLICLGHGSRATTYCVFVPRYLAVDNSDMPSQSTLLGAAGEHHVMAELLRRGYIAALAPQGVPSADIVVTDVEGTRLCSIQVKTRRDIGSDGGWHMKEKHERVRGDRLFYCFVDFGRTVEATPTVYVIPSNVVADALTKSHVRWLANPGKGGQAHKETQMRRLLPDYTRIFGAEANPYPHGWLGAYRDAWHLLGLEARVPTRQEDQS